MSKVAVFQQFQQVQDFCPFKSVDVFSFHQEVLLSAPQVRALQWCGIPTLSQSHMMLRAKPLEVSPDAYNKVTKCNKALLQVERIAMPLDVHKNYLRICIAHPIEHQTTGALKGYLKRTHVAHKMSFFDSAAGVEAKRR